MAAMGEMIAAIAHNWRQPLNTVSLLCVAITNKFNSSNLSKDYLNEWLLKINKQIDFMSQTIDDFRNFYKPQEEFKKISIKESILKIVSLLNTDFKVNGIDIKIDIEDSIYLICLENQLKQALINILINAKDAIKNNNIENGEIFISVKKNKSSVEILIQANSRSMRLFFCSKI
jgi:signal transduction histidine kinase